MREALTTVEAVVKAMNASPSEVYSLIRERDFDFESFARECAKSTGDVLLIDFRPTPPTGERNK